MRITRDEYYLGIARAVALRSPCLRRKYGAIVVKNDAIVSTGYNGPARGSTNCEEVGCIKEILQLPHYSGYDYCPAVHAEENAVINAARNGTSVLDGILYLFGIDVATEKPVAGIPCPRCKRVLINAGVKEIVTLDENGEIVRYDVKKWMSEDRENYWNIVEKAKKNQL